MLALQVLAEMQRKGVTVVAAGDRLRFHPASALTPELVDGLRENKAFILRTLECQEVARQDTSPPIENADEVLELARARFKLPEEQRLDPTVPPAPPGRDPMVKRGTDKACFFVGDWRGTWPPDYRVHRDGGAS
jgi:TubC N-terminal docking domain